MKDLGHIKMFAVGARRYRFATVSFVGALLLLLVFSCDDIFEKDISKSPVKLIAPGNGVKTDYATQTFYWETLDGATCYSVQVVTPSFDTIRQIVADTTVTSSKFTLNLTAGSYQWRVIGKNSAYRTDTCTIWTLQIDTTNDLTKQTVLLKSPSDGAAVNGDNIQFEWGGLEAAKEYKFLLLDPGNTSISPLKDTTVTETMVYIKRNVKDSLYSWTVVASNDHYISNRAVPRKVTIDRKAPSLPGLKLPKDTATITGTTSATFTWDQTTDTGSAIFNTIYIATDNQFTSASLITSQKVTPTNNAGSFTYDFKAAKVCYWRVRASDDAGNESDFSEIRKLTIKE